MLSSGIISRRRVISSLLLKVYKLGLYTHTYIYWKWLKQIIKFTPLLAIKQSLRYIKLVFIIFIEINSRLLKLQCHQKQLTETLNTNEFLVKKIMYIYISKTHHSQLPSSVILKKKNPYTLWWPPPILKRLLCSN